MADEFIMSKDVQAKITALNADGQPTGPTTELLSGRILGVSVTSNPLLDDDGDVIYKLTTVPGTGLDLGIIRTDDDLNRTNNFQLFFEEFIGLQGALNTFGLEIEYAAHGFRSMRNALLTATHGDWRLGLALARGITEADVKRYEEDDDGLWVRMHNHRRIHIDDPAPPSRTTKLSFPNVALA